MGGFFSSSSSSTYDRVEDLPIRSPPHRRNSPSSESSSSTTTLLYPCESSLPSPPLNASVSPSPSLLSRSSTASGPLPSKQTNDSGPKISFSSFSPPPKSNTLPFSPQSSSRPSESKTLPFSSQFQQADANRRSPGTTTGEQKQTADAKGGNPELNGKTSAKVPDSTHNVWAMRQASTNPSKSSLHASASPLTSSVPSKLPAVADPLSSKCSSSSHGPSTQVWINDQSTLNFHHKSSLLLSATLPLNTSSNVTDTFESFFQKQQTRTPEISHHDSTLIFRDSSSDSPSSTTPHSSKASPCFKKSTLA